MDFPGSSDSVRGAQNPGLVLMTTDAIGGVWTYSLELSQALGLRGVRVLLASMGGPLDDEKREAAGRIPSLEFVESAWRLEWMQAPWSDVERAGEWLLNLERALRPDLIHVNGYVHAALPWMAPVLVAAHSCVVSWHHAVRGSPPGCEWERYRQEVGRGLRAADIVTAPTEAMLADLRVHYGSFNSAEAVPNGRRPPLRPSTGAGKEPLVIAAGRLWDEAKNIGSLDRVARDLSWPVYAAGDTRHPEGGEARPENLECLGLLTQEMLYTWLERAAVFAHPARYEPFGLVPLEAALAECALVLGDIPSLREVWGDAAWFVPPDDPEALANALNTLAADDGLRCAAAARAREHAVMYTPDAMAAGYLRLYGRLLEKSDGGRLRANGIGGGGRSRENGTSDGGRSRANGTSDGGRSRANGTSDGGRSRAIAVLPAAETAKARPSRDTSSLKVALFYHSLVSDWNHGNAHFLRGIAWELRERGHDVHVFEPRDGWSRSHLVSEHGSEAIQGFRDVYPGLDSMPYDLARFDLERALDGVDLAVVHEWNDPELIARLGRHRRRHPEMRLLFHDTHHRAVTSFQTIAAFDLSHYDGVLAYGEVLRRIYLERGWARAAWTWHEAADTRVFRPLAGVNGHPRGAGGDLVWIGNWGDDERTAEIEEFLLAPVRILGLRARAYGVRYPIEARERLGASGVEYGGWIPNYRVPETFAKFKVTVHIPRRPYVQSLPGIPTIRPFEAFACGIPLVSSPWDDAEHLFTPGRDYLVARNTEKIAAHLRLLVNEPKAALDLVTHARKTILERHTCAHRVDELLAIAGQLGIRQSQPLKARAQGVRATGTTTGG